MSATATASRVESVSIPVKRLETLCDPDSFRAVRSAAGDGVHAGTGRIGGSPVVVWAQDGAVRGGSLGTAGGETIARAIQLGVEARVPIIGLPHSGGARLQEGIAALSAYAAIFRAQSLAEVPQLTVVCGPCAGGAAYGPALGDLTIMAGPDARLFLTGPRVIARVTGEEIDAEELGGPTAQTRNGIAHMRASDEDEAADLVRSLLAHLPRAAGEPLPLAPVVAPVPGDPAAPIPDDPRRIYDVREVASRILDGGGLLELADRWARNLVVGFGRLDGSPVGLIANQPRHLGGTLDAAASEKGAWFVRMCDRFGIPLVVLVDTPGFLPGAGQERAAIIRHGAGLVSAFAQARVPRVTVTLRAAYGGAHIVMNSRDLGATLTLAWPGSRLGVMGARQAVEVTERAAIASGADPERLACEYEAEHLPVDRAAATGHVDEVVEPAETRGRISATLGAWG